MTLYDFNKIGYLKIPKLTEEEKQNVIKDIQKFLSKHDSEHYMILNAEGRDYTVYRFKNAHLYKAMSIDIISLMEERGSIKSIEISEDSVDFWIEKDDKQCYMYKLFPYDWGVIKI